MPSKTRRPSALSLGAFGLSEDHSLKALRSELGGQGNPLPKGHLDTIVVEDVEHLVELTTNAPSLERRRYRRWTVRGVLYAMTAMLLHPGMRLDRIAAWALHVHV